MATVLCATPAIASGLDFLEKEALLFPRDVTVTDTGLGQPTVTVTDLSLVETAGALPRRRGRRNAMASPMEGATSPLDGAYGFVRDPNRLNVDLWFDGMDRPAKRLPATTTEKQLEKRFTQTYPNTISTSTYTPTASALPLCDSTGSDNRTIVVASTGYHYLVQCTTTYNVGGGSPQISTLATSSLAACISYCDGLPTCTAAVWDGTTCSARTTYSQSNALYSSTMQTAICLDCYAGTVQCPRDDGTTYTNQGITFTIQCGCNRQGGTTTGAGVQSFDLCMQQCIGNTACLGASWLYRPAGTSGTCYQKSYIGNCQAATNTWSSIITVGRAMSYATGVTYTTTVTTTTVSVKIQGGLHLANIL